MSNISLAFGLFVAAMTPALVSAKTMSDVSERLPGHEESWIALIIVLGSVSAAWFLNHRAPTVRVFGTLLAASGCFAVVAWFTLYVTSSGFLENPKPYDAPLDAAKPTLLWLQVLIAFVAGLGLLFAAFQQSKHTHLLELHHRNEADGYGRVSRILHWATAWLFIAMIPMGIFATMIPEGTPYRLEYYVVHKTLGVVIFALLLTRLIWNRLSRRPVLDSKLTPLERKLAACVHITLYVMLFAFPVSGFIMTSYFGAPTYFFAWEMQPLWDANEKAVLLWGLVHKYLLPYLLYVILGAHILAVLKHQFFDKHINVLKRIVS